MKKIITVLLIVTFFVSCSGGKNKPQPLNSTSSYEEFEETDAVKVPFKQIGGVRYINVKINGIEYPMIFDTGCSGVLISIAEVYTLAKNGSISANDIVGYQSSQIADGSIKEHMVINIREIQVGDIVCKNVKASVSDNPEAPLLLGNGVLDRVKSFEIDNNSKEIIFHLK